MIFRDHLLNHPSLILENNVFYQQDVGRGSPFENEYIRLREREGRVYTDEIVKSLPLFSAEHQLNKEWLSRSTSLNKLLTYLKNKGSGKFILEVGCGNGWLSHALAVSLGNEICAMDVNETELLQGARVFGDMKNLSFLYSDVFTFDFREQLFDTIVLASSVQYFPDVKGLVNRLLQILKPSGEIHILDSPLYSSTAEIEKARGRSAAYFQSLGFPGMTNKYFHHGLHQMNGLNYAFLSSPSSLINKIRRKILSTTESTFPWIVVRHA